MKKPKILIFTDAASPQVNGVVNTLNHTVKELTELGVEALMITPNDFKTIPFMFYPDIDFAITHTGKMKRIIIDENPDYIHIATEGPIGFFAARACKKLNFKYTSSYHTKFPDYVNMRFPFIPKKLVYSYLKSIHKNSKITLVPTVSMREELHQEGICRNISVWGRGVDHRLFYNSPNSRDDNTLRLLYVGRVSVEKSVDEFLDIDESLFDQQVEKIVVGDGPDLTRLKKEYERKNNIQFLGVKKGEELANEYRKAHVFVFPSKTDTFGLVMLEAMACGTPVAAYNVTGPRDIVMPYINGFLDDDLGKAVKECLKIKSDCSNSVKELTWHEITKNFWKDVKLANSDDFF